MATAITVNVHLPGDEEIEVYSLSTGNSCIDIAECVSIFGNDQSLRKILGALQDHFGETPEQIEQRFLENFDFAAHMRSAK